MNTIPLVKGNTQEEINTSLIALKKALDEMNSSSSKTDASVQSQIKQINELIENINTQIEDLQPVDTVTSGNMHSVTSNAVSRATSYSTDEVDTGKKYINGNNIYSKTYDFGYLPNSTTKTMSLNIDNLEQITKIKGVANKSSGIAIPLPFINISNLSYSVQLSISQNNIEVQTGFNYSEYFARITIEYTKTV